MVFRRPPVDPIRRYINENLMFAEIIAEPVAMAKKASEETNRGQWFSPALRTTWSRPPGGPSPSTGPPATA
ncbi:hypothetical protein [Micromonospora aurantiaca (nom. illeg.)]|uniref:hypothetical protein n=1 Tax=Micromonospora aurantiaca (nom. illeg.) TaxID=47850 RepID=UPI0034481955